MHSVSPRAEEEGLSGVEVVRGVGPRSASLRATRAFAQGEAISAFGARERLAQPTYRSLQVGDARHILLEPAYLEYVNHSCEPNAFFNVEVGRLECLRAVAPGEEVTFFYPSTEWDMAEGFECRCGRPRCFGEIRGAAHLPADALERYALAEHVRERARRQSGARPIGRPEAEAVAERQWWERPDLRYEGGILHLAGTDLESLAASAGGPAYAYSVARVSQKIAELRDALAARRIDHRVYFAMKANRHPGLLALLAREGAVGVDCCSPAEILLARQSGFAESDISFTATGASSGDIAVLARHPRVTVNCDSVSQIRRLASACPGRAIGLRVNPGLGVSYNADARLAYAGPKTTKFGIYREQLGVALEAARSGGLSVVGLHCHSGWGFANDQLAAYREILRALRAFLEHMPELRYVNLGGGLGVPLRARDAPFDVERFADVVAGELGSLAVPLYFEPGDYLVKDSGVLLLQVTAIETKRDRVFVYVDGGHNLNVEAAHYGLPHEIVPVRMRSERAPWSVVTVAGNINEAIDLFAENIPMPALEEGDYVALVHAGGYGASMSSNHCMRGAFAEYLVG